MTAMVLKLNVPWSGPPLKKGKSRVLFGLDDRYSAVALVGLGKQQCAGIDKSESLEVGKENARIAASG
ncbi:hypothetical protein J437_LFUL014402 [Ladona fulva]|uniref:Uncharacterized protein n=1 Tax=Ladona fulva TaxID=123851 RepID=A0A8K0PAM0_LADFU|nr:hypothetical protein J437_LFUL014402 [Ladona fulva]